MSTVFNPAVGLIVVNARIDGPKGSASAKLALDTGATRTVLTVTVLTALGYNLSTYADQTQVTTGSGTATVPRVPVLGINTLGIHRSNLLVIAMALPDSTAVDGLLGLDFFCGTELNIDFRSGRIRVRQ